MTSLSRRVSTAVVGITSGVVLVASAVLWLATQSVLLSGTDRELVGRAERFKERESLATPDAWRRPPPQMPDQRERRRGPWDRGLMQVFATVDGKELYRSASLAAEIDLVPPELRDQLRSTPWSRTLPDGNHLRVFAVRLTRGERPPTDTPAGAPPDGSRPAPPAPALLAPALLASALSSPNGKPTLLPGVTIFFAHDLQQTDDELRRMAVALAVLSGQRSFTASTKVWMKSS